jgi:transcriptional regulator with XRE-family HTH domain
MAFTSNNFGDMVRAHREHRGLTQDQLAATITGANRSIIAHLEQGLRVPQPFTQDGFEQLLLFEESLSELVGQPVELCQRSETTDQVARESISHLFGAALTDSQSHDLLNSILIHYSVRPLISREFFTRYLRADSFKSVSAFGDAVRRYQREAIRIFNSFSNAYDALNSCESLQEALRALRVRDDAVYRDRTAWDQIEIISNEKLPNLGYVAANLIKQEQSERLALSVFLKELSISVNEKGTSALTEVSEKKRRKMDGLLRKFNTTLQHGFLSQLFVPDSDQLSREADSIAPKDERDLAVIADTQQIGFRNLARYLAADHLDVYMATSMRVDADFVSVNSFATKLFAHEEIHPLKLRYFNPTQSWIEDRVAKGLVEALMLKRAAFAIYMAQKDDSFGKDSEASVALGQGKPVIVYVPKLHVPDINVDSEEFAKLTRDELTRAIAAEGTAEDKEVDETIDARGLVSRLLEIRLQTLSGEQAISVARTHWADFGLYSEAQRIVDDELRALFRTWLDSVVKKSIDEPLPDKLKDPFYRILVPTAIRFEDRSSLFRETHPLALQVILSTGILNGMIVVRSVDSCAHILKSLIRNDLQLDLQMDAHNYRLIETSTNSTIRVISRHALIKSAFSTFYES